MTVTVVGIGADGWDGLPPRSQAELRSATALYGSARQLALLPSSVRGTRTPWASPLAPHLDEVLRERRAPIHIVASGDPMFHGIGSVIARQVDPTDLVVLPHISSVSLAAARLGWDLAQLTVTSLMRGTVEQALAPSTDGARLLILARDKQSAPLIAQWLRGNGFGWSVVTVLEQLGGPAERVYSRLARSYEAAAGDDLAIVAVECFGPTRSVAPQPDSAFGERTQITKQPLRAATLALLNPAPRQLLWDVGSGTGSVAIDWLRVAGATARAIAFESQEQRRNDIRHTAQRLGVGGLSVRESAPAAFTDAPDPDAVFVGGGLTTAGLLSGCWDALESGGVLVAHAVTVESEELLLRAYREWGGALQRWQVHTFDELGSLHTWRPALPITQYRVTKS